MDPQGSTVQFLITVACVVVFLTTFFIGDVAGYLIEARTTRRWRTASIAMGFTFNEQKTRCPSLSRLFLPKLLWPGTKESPFCYGQVMQSLHGKARELDTLIADFTVWNYFTRGPLVYRATVCVISGHRIALPGQMAVLKPSSLLLQGFVRSNILRQYDFSQDEDFSRMFILLADRGAPPWIVTPEVRRFCVRHWRDIDSVVIEEKSLLLVLTDKNPDRFPLLVETAVGLTVRLIENVPAPYDERVEA
jgi:hypothetical protein